MSETKADTVPGLGFKDKEKALETLKNLEGRDPDYQKLAVKGLVGRAKRTLTLTKDKEKLQNINDAMKVFEDFLRDFEINNLSKENRTYLPLASIESLLPLKTRFNIDNELAENFLKAYKEKASGDYKNLRTVSSGDDKPTWDIVRNTEIKKLLKQIDELKPDLWKDDLPTKEHMELVLWAYSPDASRIKKNVATYEEKLGTLTLSSEDDDSQHRTADGDGQQEQNRGTKRKSEGAQNDESGSDEDQNGEDSPNKKEKKDE